MKKNTFNMMLLAMAMGVVSCSDDADSTVERLSVAAFYPTIVMDGTEVSITGTGLSDVTTVEFPGGQVAKSVQVINDSRIIAVAPTGVDAEAGTLTVSTGTEQAQSRQTIRKAQPALRYFNPAESVKTYDDLQIEGNDLMLVKQVNIGMGDEAITINAIDFKRKSNDNITITLPGETPIGNEQPISAVFDNGELMVLGNMDIERGAQGGHWEDQEIDIYNDGDVVMKGDWSSYFMIDKSVLADAQVGNVIRVYIKDKTSDDNWVILSDGNWSELAAQRASDEDMAAGYKDFTLDENMLAAMQSTGLLIRGINFTAVKVVLVVPVWVPNTAGPVETVLNDTETDMGGWSAAIIIGKEAFENAKTGNIIRVYIKNQVEGWQQGSFKNGSDWGGLTDELGVIGLSTQDFEIGYYEMTIDDVTLPLLQDNGLIISGCNYTAVKVVLIQ
ncbi:IPT/TIG domain-containing protein [Prevotella sp. P6B4]|uniref:IPT/TIG domain-containing protein n=1 Tax=Prevotella sp. P6B4 TaxID=1410614 RepID=UPI000491D9D2|nr:IPT/TIG domain-containing protein [Prevotella sp. P6B4]